MSHNTTTTRTALEPATIRDQFPILRADGSGERVIYLDSGASSQKPVPVLEAMERYYRQDNANIHRGVYKLAERATEAYDQARRSVARFFGVEDEAQLVFVRNTTEAINLVAYSWATSNLNPGDVIVTTEMEHHSNLVPWQLAAKRTGARLEFIPIDGEGRLNLDFLDRHLEAGNVKLVAINHVSNMLGTINPVETIVEKAHAAGSLVLVDGAQGAPHLSVNLDALGADFYACSGHKMCGPMGSGILYGKRALLESMPPFLGGGDMIRTVELTQSTWADLPSKFEAGTPSVADAVGLGAACEYLSGIGMDAIQAHEHALTEYAYAQLMELPDLEIYGPPAAERSGVISFNIGEIHPHDVGSLLDEHNIAVRAGHHCTQPLHARLDLTASVRASFYIYNSTEDVDLLVDGLRYVRTVFG
ncbi:MAG TPA: cysteine desulfurase [Thermomicrobiales bacterium]|nr:cysteine desulfurase [Thermomicrobiales bacterium]